LTPGREEMGQDATPDQPVEVEADRPGGHGDDAGGLDDLVTGGLECDGEVTGASAGHVPLLYARDDGSHSIRELPGGPVLRVLPDADYHKGIFRLDKDAARWSWSPTAWSKGRP
jgi:hypothetical protein